MLGSVTGLRRTAAAIALLLVGGVVTACEPAQPGRACNTTDFGDDGAHWVLTCRNGRWQWLITKKQLVELVIAQQRQQPSAPGGLPPDTVVAGSVAANDDYPSAWRVPTRDAVVDRFGFPNRECTSFAAWRLSTHGYSLPVGPGDASQWDTRLAPYGSVNGLPAVGAIAQWDAFESAGGLTAGALGHVAMVQAVYADGSVMVEQYNLGDSGEYVQMRTRAPRYIHVADR